jgi:hypothetical protein
MHLYEKWSKYAFAYAHMQMHNYPKPSDHIKQLAVYIKSVFKNKIYQFVATS